MQVQSLSVRTYPVGALPVVDHCLGRLGLRELLAPYLPHPHYREALEWLVKSVLLQPNPLYRIHAWAQAFDPTLRPRQPLGDDALGRALDRLFEADRASLLTALVVRALKTFAVQTQQIHNDSTSVKFAGAYEHQKTRAVQLRRGCSKDHRPDLKQLVYCLSVSADGAVPVHFKTYAGNQPDDPTHWETWQCLGQILSRSDFLYVADSKLCVKATMLQIDQAHGRFLTIMPRTRAEWNAFAEQTAAGQVRWQPLWQRRAVRKGHRRERFEVAAGPHQLAEGFALHWYRSSDKRPRDARDRQQLLDAALRRLKGLNERRGRGPKTEPAVRRAAENILAHYHVGAWVHYQIKLVRKVQYTRQTRRRPLRQRVLKLVPLLRARKDPLALARAASMDGTFPLVTNTKLSAREALQKYKYQPHLEKRHFLSKSVLQVAPVCLKSNTRIEALMFVNFIAALVAALIERTLRQAMARRGLQALPILPEARDSKTPSYAQILDTFAARTKEQIYDQEQCIRTYVQPLTELQQTVLKLLDIDGAVYR